MKLFIGLELPLEIKNHIAHFVKPLQITTKGWEDPHDYHLTLLYIGLIPDESVAEIEKRLDHISYKPFRLELNALFFFPRRILFIGMTSSVELSGLKKIVEISFPEWLRSESKEYVPHITIKRWQRYEFDFLEASIKSHRFEPISFNIRSLALFKSEKDLQNYKYHVIHRKEFIQ